MYSTALLLIIIMMHNIIVLCAFDFCICQAIVNILPNSLFTVSIHNHVHAGCAEYTSSTAVSESVPTSSGLSGELTRSLYYYEINYA